MVNSFNNIYLLYKLELSWNPGQT